MASTTYNKTIYVLGMLLPRISKFRSKYGYFAIFIESTHIKI